MTAGNASGIGDGSVSAVLADAAWAEDRGLKPLGRLLSWGFVGVEPRIMGIGPVPASRLAPKNADLELEDMDLVEVNEAFAPQYKAVEKDLGLDPEITNVDGGAIAITARRAPPLAGPGRCRDGVQRRVQAGLLLILLLQPVGVDPGIVAVLH